MTDAEFLALSDALFLKIDQKIDAVNLDVDVLCQGNVLELNFDNGKSIVVNRNEAQQEIWLAAKSGAYHFSYVDGQWISKREHAELFATLAEVIQRASGDGFMFE